MRNVVSHKYDVKVRYVGFTITSIQTIVQRFDLLGVVLGLLL